jgi:hypothetical protein
VWPFVGWALMPTAVEIISTNAVGMNAHPTSNSLASETDAEMTGGVLGHLCEKLFRARSGAASRGIMFQFLPN